MRMEGRMGLVTASASGMGRAGAIRFAKEGAKVAVVDINEQGVNEVVETIRKAGGTAIGITGNLRDDQFSRSIVSRTVKEFGGIDFMWCHAGHPGPSDLDDMNMETFATAFDLNIRTAIMATLAAIPEMKKRKNSSLLYTSSTAGVRGSPRSPIYSTMKFGIVGFARSLAKRLAPDIRANVIAPGGVDTPMLRHFVARPDQKETLGKNVEELVAKSEAAYPFKRAAQPDEIANAALFLLSSEASYVSGVMLPVDGCVTA